METNNNPRSIISLEYLIDDIDSTIKQSKSIDIKGNDKNTSPSNHISQQYIKFILKDILLAIPLSTALEIGRCPRVTPLPNLPAWVLGVSNIRGEIISIVDLKAFFEMSSPNLKRTQRFIIIHDQYIKVGLVVDRIIGIFSPDHINTEIQDRLYQNQDSITAKWMSYISGIVSIEDNLINVFDVTKFLSCPQMNAFRHE